MSYQEKRTIVSLVSGVLLLGIYSFVAYNQYQSGAIASDNLQNWAILILIFIAIGVVVGIAIQIVFHILFSISIAVKQNIEKGQCNNDVIAEAVDCATVTDEMDTLIDLKSMRVGLIVAGIGFVAALFSQVFGYSAAVLLNVMLVSFSIASVIQSVSQLYWYRRGVSNG